MPVATSLPAARDWNEIERIEQWLLAWQSRSGEHTFAESWMMIAWYAVQESWRLALLVYLYLAVYNASSDDPRIIPHVKQILQVVGNGEETTAIPYQCVVFLSLSDGRDMRTQRGTSQNSLGYTNIHERYQALDHASI
ncbi:hypothetical protein OPQ81_000347 [Rhizoctonia solani]|nr:hypothetical protein OPQ81_000347 [Rhizoctonia solani]